MGVVTFIFCCWFKRRFNSISIIIITAAISPNRVPEFNQYSQLFTILVTGISSTQKQRWTRNVCYKECDANGTRTQYHWRITVGLVERLSTGHAIFTVFQCGVPLCVECRTKRLSNKLITGTQKSKEKTQQKYILNKHATKTESDEGSMAAL